MRKDQTRPEEYLQRRSWKKFLMSIPLGKPKGYQFQSANDMTTIRVRAAQLNSDDKCPKKFSVALDLDTRVATITATNK